MQHMTKLSAENQTTPRLRRRALLILLLVGTLILFGCAGGGGSGAGDGLGIEGTGFKVQIEGSLIDEQGAPVVAATVETDDAATVSNDQGRFSLATTVLKEQRKPLEVKTAAVTGTLKLEPITSQANVTVEIVVEVDSKARSVDLKSQEVKEQPKEDPEFVEDVDEVTDGIEDELSPDPVEQPGESPGGGGGSLDPDLVDL